MTESRRWRDDPNAPPELRALMGAGVRPRGMTDDERERAKAQLASMAVAGGAGWLMTRAMLRTIGGGKTFVAVAVVGIASAVGVFFARHADPASVAAQSMSLAHAAQSVNAQAATLIAAMRTLPSPPPRAPTPPTVFAAAPIDAVHGVRHLARVAHNEGDTLTRELSLVQGAMRALATDPAEALRLADAHAREFADGQLAAEREYVRVRALARLGRTDDARAQAHALIETHPTSIYAVRVAHLLETSGDLR